jgi:hypothetical protein
VRRRQKGSTGLGAEYEEVVHPSDPPGRQQRGVGKIVLWIVLFMPVGLYLLVRRLGGRKAVGFAVAVVVPLVLLTALGAALGPDDETSPPVAEASSKLQQPAKSPEQIRADRIRAAKVARQQASAKKRARERARAEARAHAAYVAAANRWHKGFNQQDGNVFWRWRDNLSCAEYALDGCWHVEVVTRYGCQTYVAVQANEYKGGAIINELLDNQGYGIPPKTSRIFELDADPGNVTADDLTIDCQ